MVRNIIKRILKEDYKYYYRGYNPDEEEYSYQDTTYSEPLTPSTSLPYRGQNSYNNNPLYKDIVNKKHRDHYHNNKEKISNVKKIYNIEKKKESYKNTYFVKDNKDNTENNINNKYAK